MVTPEPIRLTTFDGGRVITHGVRFLGPDGATGGAEELRDMADPNHCYLVHHPRGLLMWDTGLPDTIAALPEQTLVKGRFRFVVQRPLLEQLAAIGVQPEAVNFLAFSHLQIDHAGNAALFPQATVLIQSAEYELAFGPKADDWGYQRSDYSSLAERDLRLLDGDYDVFGDGRVMILAAPGHTPGHQVLYLDLSPSPALILSGDLFYTQADVEAGRMPAWNYDKEQTRHTMQRLTRFAAEKGARWLINHDPQENE